MKSYRDEVIEKIVNGDNSHTPITDDAEVTYISKILESSTQKKEWKHSFLYMIVIYEFYVII